MEKETKKMPFHLTITDNETGEIVRELDTDAIIGAANTSEEGAAGICVTRCSGQTLANTFVAVESMLEHMMNKEPMLRLAKMLVGAEIERKEN